MRELLAIIQTDTRSIKPNLFSIKTYIILLSLTDLESRAGQKSSISFLGENIIVSEGFERRLRRSLVCEVGGFRAEN